MTRIDLRLKCRSLFLTTILALLKSLLTSVISLYLMTPLQISPITLNFPFAQRRKGNPFNMFHLCQLFSCSMMELTLDSIGQRKNLSTPLRSFKCYKESAPPPIPRLLLPSLLRYDHRHPPLLQKFHNAVSTFQPDPIHPFLLFFI